MAKTLLDRLRRQCLKNGCNLPAHMPTIKSTTEAALGKKIVIFSYLRLYLAVLPKILQKPSYLNVFQISLHILFVNGADRFNNTPTTKNKI